MRKLQAVSAVFKCAKEHKDFGGEVGESRQPNGCERGEAETKAENRHWFRKPAKISERQRLGSLAKLACDCKQGGDGQTVREHQQRRAIESERIEGGDAKEDIA